jgi:GTPase SAR1 family protein
VVVRLQLWDIAGQERFGNMTRVFYREAVGAMVVFDLTRRSTLETVKKWKADIDAKVRLQDAHESPIPVVLLANKVVVFYFLFSIASFLPLSSFIFFFSQCDLMPGAINVAQLDAYCRENGFVRWFETSAKDGTNIDDAVIFLVQKILETESQSQPSEVASSDSEEVHPEDMIADGKGGKGSDKNCPC